MRALLTALVSLSLIGCAEDDEDALELGPDALSELPAIDSVAHPELAQDAPELLAPERSTTNPRVDVPPLDQTPSTIADPLKPRPPDSRRMTTRIPHPTNTF